ncbi:MAG TPA: (2Fe-2S)-binding protein [Methylibium sp.]|uniref:(2Fe-2S)-binding protein n=1 Tax=Methylibium sp. TaxID=2067992 RepID=UPI002DBF58A3|nr:(2Fe-2S)-binding protein [Methylibium sp.]HEU4460456.1 (2Fe-2S)-binding protein [Methylibium sp.]
MKLVLNGQPLDLPPERADPAMPLLWALRDVLNLTGTKFGCGIGACGACTVRLDGEARRACVTPLSAAEGRRLQTIEGLANADGSLHAVQAAWLDHQVPQCGYCQSGLLMAAAALLERKPRPSDAEIDAAITNLCRCGTTPRLRAAIRAAGERLARGPSAKPEAQPAAVPRGSAPARP